MSGINKVILVGHLGKDPDLRHLEGNIPVASFPLATTETFNKNGLKEEQTEWHNIVLWRSLAERGAAILKKGKLVYIEGKCRTRSFEDRNGVKKYTCEIVADFFAPLGRPGDFHNEINGGEKSDQCFRT